MNPSINRRVTRTVTVLAAGAIAALGTAGGAQAITLPTVDLAQLVANPVAIGGGTSDRGTAPTGTAPVDAVGSVGAIGGPVATGSTGLGTPGTTHDGPVATGSTSDLGSPGTTQDGPIAAGGAAAGGAAAGGAAAGGAAAGGAATGGTPAGGGGAGGAAGAGTAMTPPPCGCVASSSEVFRGDDDNEDRLWLYIVTKTVPESQDSPVAFKLSHPTNHVVEADWTTDQCDTAKPVEDYKNSGGHIRFEPGEVEKDAVVPLVNDKAVEPSEKFCVRVDHVSGATPYRDWEFAQIDDDDPQAAASVSLGDIKVKPRARRACFVLKIRGVVTQPVKVKLDTVSGSAHEGSDFAAMHQTMVITPGMTSQKISIALADKKHADSKSFELHVVQADQGVEIEHGSGHAKLMGSGESEHHSGGQARLTRSDGSHHRKGRRHGRRHNHHRHGRH